MNEIRYMVILVTKKIAIPWIRGSEYAGQAYLATRMHEALQNSQVIQESRAEKGDCKKNLTERERQLREAISGEPVGERQLREELHRKTKATTRRTFRRARRRKATTRRWPPRLEACREYNVSISWSKAIPSGDPPERGAPAPPPHPYPIIFLKS